MTSLIFSTATRTLVPLLLLFSVFVTLRGHNNPGGGFVGGLVAASAFALSALAFDVAGARRLLRADPRTLIGAGLATACGSGLISLLAGKPYMTGLWVHVALPGLGALDVGTPVLFDIGVYLVVVGVALTIIYSLAEE